MKIFLNPFYNFLFLFFSLFLLIYFGFQFLSGLAVIGGNYSPFVEKYFNIASWIRQAIMFCTKHFVSLFGLNAHLENEYVLKDESGAAIKLIYGCLGIGVYSFWFAYTLASDCKLFNKITWLLAGFLILWSINIIRIGLVLIATKNKWIFPLGLDHHTWFNIVAYFFIFLMVFFFEKNIKHTKKTLSL